MDITDLRYKRLECKDPKKIHLFLMKARVAHIGIPDEKYPYILPMAYVWHNLKLYIHGSDEGRKNRLISKGVNASVSISEDFGNTVAPVPANASSAYMNVMMNGYIKPLKDFEKSRYVLDIMLNKYLPSYYPKDLSIELVKKFESSMGAKTEVFVFEPSAITAKLNEADLESLYFNGRNRDFDVNLERSSEELEQSGLLINE